MSNSQPSERPWDINDCSLVGDPALLPIFPTLVCQVTESGSLWDHPRKCSSFLFVISAQLVSGHEWESGQHRWFAKRGESAALGLHCTVVISKRSQPTNALLFLPAHGDNRTAPVFCGGSEQAVLTRCWPWGFTQMHLEIGHWDNSSLNHNASFFLNCTKIFFSPSLYRLLLCVYKTAELLSYVACYQCCLLAVTKRE